MEAAARSTSILWRDRSSAPFPRKRQVARQRKAQASALSVSMFPTRAPRDPNHRRALSGCLSPLCRARYRLLAARTTKDRQGSRRSLLLAFGYRNARKAGRVSRPWRLQSPVQTDTLVAQRLGLSSSEFGSVLVCRLIRQCVGEICADYRYDFVMARTLLSTAALPPAIGERPVKTMCSRPRVLRRARCAVYSGARRTRPATA